MSTEDEDTNPGGSEDGNLSAPDGFALVAIICLILLGGAWLLH